MALGRLQASLAAATNEVTVAAANINFDFTLIKCEAPKEFQDLGKALSSRRKQEAERGSVHVTARRLGALFEGVCPQTPRLMQAYGVRASEIAEIGKTTSQLESSGALFADYSGVDGTSIWAAATSSPTALHVQLLGCMLARIWSGPEATSIWVELVKERKEDIAKQFENGQILNFSTLNAANQAEIPRSQLAEWDASVRAWLRTADAIKKKEQTQLMLVLANINVSVNKEMTVLASILEAWTSALLSIEKLVGGMAQATTHGPTLLALSSWHLYPDMIVEGIERKEIRFNDPIVSASGSLTVGLEVAGNDDTRGIHWSLSLAHLRFYGHPVKVSGRVAQDAGRIQISELFQATLGCLLGSWKFEGSVVKTAMHVFIAIQAAAERAIAADQNVGYALQRSLGQINHWWHLLLNAAWAYMDNNNVEQKSAQRLINLGLRRSRQFIVRPEVGPFFGLLNSQAFLRCLKGPEEQIAYLRHVASTAPKPPNNGIIRYYPSFPSNQYLSESNAEYATLVPELRQTNKRNESGEPVKAYRHIRWTRNQIHRSFPPEEEIGQVPSKHQFEVEEGRRTLYFGPSIYELAFGDDATAAAFTTAPAVLGDPTLSDLLYCLSKDFFSMEMLFHQINVGLDPLGETHKTLCALQAASMVYKLLPDATVSVNVLQKPITKTKWLSSLCTASAQLSNRTLDHRSDLFNINLLDRSTAFACIAYMESGSLDIEPSILTNVMAMSSEDSLFIAIQLTCDPSESPQRYELTRVLGNIGRPGITMLVPPENPVMREVNPSSWKFIENNPFNFCAENHFEETSLHLHFTEYYVPIVDMIRHEQDMEVFFLESVVSIYDRGKWVGDIDILRALDKVSVSHMMTLNCTNPHHRDSDLVSKAPDPDIISIECWDEIIDLPTGYVVVRASGNWVARLAITSVLSQKLSSQDKQSMATISVCPAGFCWHCNSLFEPPQAQNRCKLPSMFRIFVD